MRIKRESLLGVITTADQETQWAIWSTGTLGTVSHSHTVSRPKVVCVKVAHQGFEGKMSQPDPSSYFHIIQFFTRSTVLMEWWERTGEKKQIVLELASCPNVSQRIQEAGLLTQAICFPSPKDSFQSDWCWGRTRCSCWYEDLLIAWAVCLQCPFDTRCSTASGVFSSSHAFQQLYRDSTVSASSTKILHTHTHIQSATQLILGQQFFWKAEGSQPLTIVGSSFILPCCPVFYGT